MELGRKRLKKHVGHMIDNDKTATNDLVNLRNLMHELRNSELCTNVCPCFPDCQTRMEYGCHQLVARYLDRELTRILRGLNAKNSR